MQTLERTNDRVSTECIELLIRERNKGKSLRPLGQMFGRSHERIRQILARCDLPQELLLSEKRVAAKLGYPVNWLARLRKEGITNPTKCQHYWLYSEEQVSQIASLITERRKCELCGEPRPFGYPRLRIPVKSATCPHQIGRLSGQIGHPLKRVWKVAPG